MNTKALFVALGFFVLVSVGIVSAQQEGAGCENRYWFDDNDKSCSQKEFCGAYMYQGLQTFDSEEECEDALDDSDDDENDDDDSVKCITDEDCIGSIDTCSCRFECEYKSEHVPSLCARMCGTMGGSSESGEIENNSCVCQQGKCLIATGSGKGRVCTQDIKRCPDGSSVSRNPEKECKFEECKKNRGNMTFTPWQKRNESECVVGCKCVGAVMSCPTETGKTMTITAGRSGNVIIITVDKTEVNTTLELEVENGTNNKTRIRARMSDGRKAEVKIMPETASLRARERLGELGFNITLKEVGKKAVYDVEGEKEAKVLGMFKKRARVNAEIDAETGEVTKVKKPWWAFAATGI